MNFLKNATNAVKDIVDSSDEDEPPKRELKQKKVAPLAAKNEDNTNRSRSSSFSSADTEDLEEAGAIVADVFTGGIYGNVEMAVEAAELAEATYKANQMKKAMEWIKGRRVFLVRHANAGDAPKDEDRPVTTKGEGQCAAFCSSFGAELEGVTLAFCSPSLRTVDTARLLGFPDAIVVPDLYFGPHLNDEIRELESELGYAPIADYLRGKGEEIYDPVRIRMGTALGNAGMSEIEKNEKKDGDVLVVGHAMYISLLALEVVGAMKFEEKRKTTTMEKTKTATKAAWKNIKTMPQIVVEEASKVLGEQSGEEDSVEATCEEVAKILSFNVREMEGFEISSEAQVRLLQ